MSPAVQAPSTNERRQPGSKKSRNIWQGLTLEIRTNLFLGTREMGERILRYVVEIGDIYIPESFDSGPTGGSKILKFDPMNLSAPLKGWTDSRYSLGIIARRRRPVDMTLHVTSTEFLMFDHLTLSIGSEWFVGKDQHVQEFVEVAKGLYRLTQANSAYIKNHAYERAVGEVVDSSGNLVGYNPPEGRWSLGGLFWANFFGPEYVELFGRDKLLSAGWQKTESLPDGGLLLFISESPFDASKRDYELRKQQLYGYLGSETFTGKVLPKFRTDGRKKRDARPLRATGGLRDDVFH